jgi:hypothetical protein
MTYGDIQKIQNVKKYRFGLALLNQKVKGSNPS